MRREPTVFVIEDENPAEDSAALVIRNHGFTVRAFTSCEAFLNAVQPDQSGCVVADGRMAGTNGLDLLAALAAGSRWMPVIIVTGDRDVEMAVSAIKRGALDVVKRPLAAGALVEKVLNALDHDRERQVSQMAASAIKRRIDRLTPREREVMELVVTGLSNKSIARRLGIGHRTVEVHRAHLMEKMQASSSAELILMVVSVKGVSALLSAWATANIGFAQEFGADRLLLPVD